MYQKGYRANYRLDQTETDRIFFSGNLRSCLEQYFSLMADKSYGAGLKLSTHPVYEPGIDCQFDIMFDSVKGFKVQAMRIEDIMAGQLRTYRFQNNHQIPGASSLYSLFPRKKPWDDFLKGKKFRP